MENAAVFIYTAQRSDFQERDKEIVPLCQNPLGDGIRK